MSRILHVVNISFVLPYYIGNQFDYFRERGHEFFVACTPSEHFFKYAKEKNFKAFGINILRQINPVEDIKSIFKLARYIKKNKIEIVIGHTPKGSMIAMVAAAIAGIEHRVYFRHGLMYETSSGFKRMLLMGVEKLTGKLAKKVVCVSNSVIEKSIKANLNNQKKNILLNKGTCNGIDLAIMSPKEIKNTDFLTKLGVRKEDKVVGFVGRLVNDKGVNELLDAWQKIKDAYDNVKLLLVGPYEERDSISEKARSIIDKSESIISAGLQSNIVPFYEVMDVFILPSYREGFPTVVLEASAMQLPVITTAKTGCIDSIINGRTGIFTEINAEGIFNAIKYYLENPNIAERHGLAGRRFVQDNFRQEVIWKEIEEKVLNNIF
jgi:glycosyltransferase involved in cell wall biosynthesis